jgi:phosphopentomutase
MDSVGVGAAHDAADYGDLGADTLGHIAESFAEYQMPFSLPNVHPMPQHPPAPAPHACWGTMRPAALGKDTTVGHWEMAGLILTEAFATYPEGFPGEILDQLEKLTGHTFIGNKAASGTAIIDELGVEHLDTGSIILYTSADSVLQLAAHEDVVPIEEQYRVCRLARQLCDRHRIGRVIARPFVGAPGSFSRTSRRKDFSMDPSRPTILNAIVDAGLPVVGVGKIYDIFNGRGISKSHKTENNAEGMHKTLELWETFEEGLLFVNLVDFDMLYGHRNNWRGYGEALMEFDAFLPRLEALVKPGDLIMITADHGNDPTFPGTDHCRENVPILAMRAPEPGLPLGERRTFADVAATLGAHLGVPWEGPGVPFFL